VVFVNASHLPVIVTTVVPVVAVPLAVKVSELLLTAGFGLNAAVTPLGKPEAERVTRPTSGLIMIVLTPLLPCATVNVLGLADRAKVAFTVTLIAVVCVALPEVPVIVTVAVPVFAVALAVRVSVLLLPVAGLGLNPAVTPLGNPEAESVTLPLKPFNRVIVIVLVPWLPWVRVRLVGLAESV